MTSMASERASGIKSESLTTFIGTSSDGAICAFLASDRVWIWHKDTVAEYLPHVLIWLVKWIVFDQTGEWIGAEHASTPQYHLRWGQTKLTKPLHV